MSTPLEAALSYAALGWPVLPVGGDDGKKPLIKHGVSEASADPEQIRKWWARWPEANVAIATGAPGPNVLDIDNPEHPMIPDVTDLPPAAKVATTRGVHFYFVGSTERTIKLPYGELRRKGSYVIAPPSVRPDTGHVYAWLPDGLDAHRTELYSTPEWITRGRSTAGVGDAPVVKHVAPGDMYDHLLDYAVRLARGGVLDPEQRAHALQSEFERVRIPGATYGGTPEDTRRLAMAPTDILEREAGTRPPTGGVRTRLTFRTPAELREDAPAEPDWLWHGSIAAGFITIVGGRPKVGKSTIVYEAVDRMVRGEAEFLGAALQATDVVVVSEEHSVTALDKLSDSPRLHVLTREHALPQPSWQELIGDALEVAQETGAKLLLIDSFTFWAGLEQDAANTTGAVQTAFKPLVQAAHDGVAVVLIHHQRKQGGEYGEALLGSTAFAANADIILEVERLAEGSPGHWRRVLRIGRWYVPPVVVVSWTQENGYALEAETDSSTEAEDLGWAERIRMLLRPYGTSLRATELQDLLGVDGRTWARGAAMLVANGEVIRTGVGGAKDPITYTSVAPQDRPQRPEI